MLIKHLWQRVAAGWLIGLLFAGLLLLSACGGAAEEAPEATEAPNQEEAAEVAADTPEPQEETQEDPTEEAVAETTDEIEPADSNEEEIASVPVESIVCEAVEIPENASISPISNEDWSKGPEDALVTVIEFGDFQ